MRKIIFVEGISGAGKSTVSVMLCEKLCGLGYPAGCFLEGDTDSPLDLFYTAYLTMLEYAGMLREYPGFADKLQKNSIIAPDYALVRYRDTRSKYYAPRLCEYLESREFCYNAAAPPPMREYSNVFVRLWRRFAQSSEIDCDFLIFDGSLLHHQINDLIRNYNAGEYEIAVHLTALLRTVGAYNPVVLYLLTDEVGKQLTEARKSRGKAPPTADEIAFWEKRKRTDLSVLEKLPAETFIADITDGSRDYLTDKIIGMLI
jgi:hypothetical protein